MIGRCHDQRPGLPNGVGPTDVMYGVKTIKGNNKPSKVNTNNCMHTLACINKQNFLRTWPRILEELHEDAIGEL